jgi:hypothetical protein
MPQTREEIRAARQRTKTEYRELFDATAALFFRHDPIGINFNTNTDEYEPEVCTILPRLHACHSESDVCRVVYEEFTRWFGADTVGRPVHYQQIAIELWALWRNSRPPHA